MKRQRLFFVYACLLVPLLFFIGVRIVPIVYSFLVGFREWDLLSEEKPFVGFSNYVALYHDPVFLTSLRNTVFYVLLGVPGQLAAGLAIALLLRRIIRFRAFFRTVYFLPYVTSVVAVSWVFRWIFMKNGIVNGLLLQLGLPSQLFLGSPDQAIFIVTAAMIWQNLGFQMLIFLTGLENIPKEYEEAAAIDGAGAWQRFVHVTLPLLNPVLLFSVIIASISYLQSFTQILNMTSGGGPLNSTKSVVVYIYELAFKQFNMGQATAATVVLFLLILLLSLLQLKTLNRKVEY
ncbi:sugar ABC transporter permease [Paenibacillus chitinolyticus]|uniref:Sugar ABC transporter permease n=1 Tax=Paenibacillus chitinolyticus TaxID=79263 RepID=A0A410X1K3_9BACL|nr:sugar ABC transporter permease [Paenibacillus chitinolyticus]MCY9592579.1 sugar ABC transporter permease [Paenibacillus chitinolyticus]MCY9594818.1 sugar ABC transporter permease [Paenibacillus chitinolyticus]QAV20496.1 sugar ABC transporter permease [Paenibacillus chitinolyticus]